MTDIVERLRGGKFSGHDAALDLMEAAADEIERLRKAHEDTAAQMHSYINMAGDQIAEIERLRKALGVIADEVPCLCGNKVMQTFARKSLEGK